MLAKDRDDTMLCLLDIRCYYFSSGILFRSLNECTVCVHVYKIPLLVCVLTHKTIPVIHWMSDCMGDQLGELTLSIAKL